jgi:hypothetical protein
LYSPQPCASRLCFHPTSCPSPGFRARTSPLYTEDGEKREGVPRRGVAVQAECKEEILKPPDFYFTGSRVETRRFQATGRLDATCTQPHRERLRVGECRGTIRRRGRAVALQVAFERQILKPGFHYIGYRLWACKTLGYGLWVNLIPTCRAPPRRLSSCTPLGKGKMLSGSASCCSAAG